MGTRRSNRARGAATPSADVSHVLARLSRIQSGGAPTPAAHRPRTPSAAATSSTRTHRIASSFGGPASVGAHATPSAANPSGGIGRHATRPGAASGEENVSRSNRSGGAVNAGESRTTSDDSSGGAATPDATTSPSDAYPAGGFGRHTLHAAAPTRAFGAPSSKTEGVHVVHVVHVVSSLDHTLRNTRHRLVGADAVAAASRDATRASVATRSALSESDTGDAPTVIRESSVGFPRVSSRETYLAVTSVGETTSPPAPSRAPTRTSRA